MPHQGRILALAAVLGLLACGPAEERTEGGAAASGTSAPTDPAAEGFDGDGAPRFTALHLPDRTVVTVAVEVEESPQRWIASIRLLDGDGEEIGTVEREGPGARGRPVVASFDAAASITAVTAEITDGSGTTWRRSWRVR